MKQGSCPGARKCGARRNIQAFTLIELIAVISVITILAALLIPMALRSLEAANRSKCAANLKTLATAVLNYTYENNGYLPFSVDADAKPWFWSAGNFIGAQYTQQEYINWRDNFIKRGISKVLYCPSAVVEDIQAPFDVSYGINSSLCYAYNAANPSRQPQKPLNISRHAEVILITDGKSYSEDGGHAWRVASRVTISNRHKQGANIAWLDGHVTWESNERLDGELSQSKYWAP